MKKDRKRRKEAVKRLEKKQFISAIEFTRSTATVNRLSLKRLSFVMAARWFSAAMRIIQRIFARTTLEED